MRIFNTLDRWTVKLRLNVVDMLNAVDNSNLKTATKLGYYGFAIIVWVVPYLYYGCRKMWGSEIIRDDWYGERYYGSNSDSVKYETHNWKEEGF